VCRKGGGQAQGRLRKGAGGGGRGKFRLGAQTLPAGGTALLSSPLFECIGIGAPA